MPRSAVAHRDRHSPVTLQLGHGRVLGPDGQNTAFWHGIARVHGKVDQGDLELGGVELDRPERRIEVELDPNVASQRLHEHIVHADDQRIHVDHLGLERVLAPEGQQLAGQPTSLLDGSQCVLDETRSPLLGRPPQQIEIAHDDGEQVVEVVGDAAGELAHASIFCAWCSCSSMRRVSVMSSVVAKIFVTCPAGSKSGTRMVLRTTSPAGTTPRSS
jgi:hypothetical protein